jgi:tyrosine-protein kinase Etk/Wzc
MHEANSLSPLEPSKNSANEEMMNLRKLISIILANKYILVGTLAATLSFAYLYNTFTIPEYRVSASILIEEDKKAASSGNDQLLEGFGLMPGMKNFDNQTMVLSSRTLINKTLDKLNFDLEFYYKGLINEKSLYPVKPFAILTDSGARLPEEVEFAIKNKGNSMFRITTESANAFKIDKLVAYGEKIEYPGCSFRIELNDYELFADKNAKKLYFKLHSRRNLVGSYVKRLEIARASKLGSIVKISLEGTNRIEDQAFLSKLTEIFLNISLERKNNEAIRTIQFIDDQLAGISDSLVITENKLQQFRSTNKVMNLSAQGQIIINQVMSLENEKARLGIEANYYNYLMEYLEKDMSGEVPIAPATSGISDPGLTKLVADLAEQQSRLYSKSMGDKNPLQNQYAQKVLAIKESLKETLKGLSSANNLALRENQEQINNINEKATVLPRTERQLLGIERKYKLNDELYNFLLEKRAITQMQKASNIADNEMIEYPEYENLPISPKKPLAYLLAILSGIGLPLFWIFLREMLNIRIRTMDEVNQLTEVPSIGYIPHNPNKKTTLVLEEPDSPVAEAFRLLRSKLIFFTRDIKSPVILITSTIPNEGKTFTAINLASAYSLMGKKTILVGFDLRQPMIYTDFKLGNEKGVSTWLLGKDGLQDIIKESGYTNLSIISSGPIPPNPTELTLLKKTDELFKLLKENYDYIIVDSSPAGIVSDTLHLVSQADVCILIVRQNCTSKDLFINTIHDLKMSKLKHLRLLFNDLDTNNRRYGYGGRYVYNHANSNQGLINKLFGSKPGKVRVGKETA